MSVADGQNVGAAIGLVCLAGATSTIGASVVFFPFLVKRASRRVLAASLGLSAGVMLYISFVEIFVKSVDGFVSAGIDEGLGYLYASLSFFGGVLFMKLIELCIRRLSKPKAIHREQDEDIEIEWNVNEDCQEPNVSDYEEIVNAVPHYCVGCSNDPGGELEEWHELAELELQGGTPAPISEITIGRRQSSRTLPGDEESGSNLNVGEPLESRNIEENRDESKQEENPTDATEEPKPIVIHVENIPRPQGEDNLFRSHARPTVNPKEEKRKLAKMGFSTALAIIVHNFPEGLATFVAALKNPSVGGVLAVAIGIHNVPEGLCVALPIYYATGNRWKAFRWGCFAGISEPIDAILGWLVLANVMTDEMFAILFGFVSGIMVMISMKELIPTAHRYDPEDTVVTNSILVGMAVVTLSLALFKVKP